MDTELLMALIFLWCSTTTALVIFLSMWFRNRGETFHPHSVEVDSRHPMFLVVGDCTHCKPSFVVKSISAFVAPRGSSSNKHFTALIIIMSISGMFGTLRWNSIEDASFEESRLAMVGFGALILTAAFETDVSNGRFLEDKLMVTAWLLQKLQLDTLLPFSLDTNSLPFRQFLRHSKLYCYFKEEDRFYVEAGDHTIHYVFPYMPWWSALHTMGAVIYVLALPTAVLWHEQYQGSQLAATLTWVAFLVFCLGGYLTGTYLPVIGPLQCIILQWNPFFLSATFLEELHEAVVEFANGQSDCGGSDSGCDDGDENVDCVDENCRDGLSSHISESPNGSVSHSGSSLRKRSTRRGQVLLPPVDSLPPKKSEGSKVHFSREEVEEKVSRLVNSNPFLRFARHRPEDYLQLVGHLMVMFEMVAVLLPSIAIGISWMTALCPDTPANALVGLMRDVMSCALTGKDCDFHAHCILR